MADFTEEPTPKEHFLRSLERCAQSDAFIPAFYDRFLSTSGEIKKKFQRTDFEKQNKMLLRSLRLAAGATAGDPDALEELSARAESHDRDHLDIEPSLYGDWVNAAVATAEAFDDQWDAAVESAWRATLGYIVQYMIKRY